jgi:hypothetical protein
VKVTVRDVMGELVAVGTLGWTIDPERNPDYIAAFRRYSFPLVDEHGTVLGQLEVIP